MRLPSHPTLIRRMLQSRLKRLGLDKPVLGHVIAGAGRRDVRVDLSETTSAANAGPAGPEGPPCAPAAARTRLLPSFAYPPGSRSSALGLPDACCPPAPIR